MSMIRKTACSRDCPDACSIVVETDGDRAIALSGDREDPITRGFLCERTNRFLFRQYHADRLTTPLLRKNGVLSPVSWDEALDFTAAKLQKIRAESGPAAIMHYRSGGSLGILKALGDYVFECFGPVTVKHGDICNGSGEWAQEEDFGISESSDIFDLLNAKTIVLWGKNVHTSATHLLPILREAKANGTKIVVVEMSHTKAKTLADLYIMPRPGGDYALAMGVARRLFDIGAIDPRAPEYTDNFDAYRALVHEADVSEWARRADCPAAEVVEFARHFAEAAPVGIQIGWGLARRRNGATAVRAIDALGAVSGNVGIPGGCVSYYYGRRTAFDMSFVKGRSAAPRSLSEPRLGEELLAASDPPVRAFWCTAGNPVTMLPDSATVARALASRELLVVVDTHKTDTTDLATVVLPTLTLLEDSDLIGAYGNHFLRASDGVIPPAGEARHEVEIWTELAKRLGIGDRFAGTVDDWRQRALKKLIPEGITLEKLRSGPVKNPFAAPVLFEGRKFKTKTGRVNLITRATADAPAADAEYPLLLLAASVPEGQSSQWSVDFHGAPMPVRVHPGSAHGFLDGERAVLESRHDSVDCVIRIDPTVRPEVAICPKGGMMRDGRCANRLVRAAETDHGCGAAYYDEPVRFRRAAAKGRA